MLGASAFALVFAAGVLSTLSPCVLPLVPIVLGSAAASHRHAPLALAAGLAVSYAVVGSLLAWAAASLGMDTTVFRMAGAVLLGFMGIVLMSTALQARFAMAGAGIGNIGNRMLAHVRGEGLPGQFAVGVLLGLVWSPCVGPTLGGAVALASQGDQLVHASALMGVFGLGAAAPLLALTYLSRQQATRLRTKLLTAGKLGKVLMGGMLVLLAASILSGADKSVETWLVEKSPAWLTELTTRF